MAGYDSNSCSKLEKVYYRPIEAALRWCGLIEHEGEILQITGENLIPQPSDFPMWPCLRANAEKIHDAVLNGDLPYGRDGRAVPTGENVAKNRLTIRHTDMKEWMAKHYPDQKPEFLFDAVERSTHSAINADSFRALQADRDAARAELIDARKWADEIQGEVAAVKAERDRLLAAAQGKTEPAARAETTYLNIIGALLNMTLGASPSGKKHSVFESQATIIDFMLANHGHLPGISKTTLESKFSNAKKSISSS
jgi:hypothetical protein